MSNDNPETATRREDPPKKKAAMGPGEIEKFDNLLIRALFGDNIKSHASDKEREHVFGEIRAVCLTRGLTQFMEDLRASDNSFIDVMSSYGANVASFMQTILDNLHDSDQKGNADTPSEQELLQFFRDRGVTPRKPTSAPDTFLKGLREFATANGIDGSTFDALMSMVEEDGRDGCDCPHHRTQRAMRDAVTKHCGIKQEHQDGYSVVCPDHGRVFLSDAEYTEQLLDPDKGWYCTRCDVKALLYEEEDHGK